MARTTPSIGVSLARNPHAAGGQDRGDIIVVGDDSQRDDPHRRLAAEDQTRRRRPVEVRHLDVHEDHVGAQFGSEPDAHPAP